MPDGDPAGCPAHLQELPGGASRIDPTLHFIVKPLQTAGGASRIDPTLHLIVKPLQTAGGASRIDPTLHLIVKPLQTAVSYNVNMLASAHFFQCGCFASCAVRGRYLCMYNVCVCVSYRPFLWSLCHTSIHRFRYPSLRGQLCAH